MSAISLCLNLLASTMRTQAQPDAEHLRSPPPQLCKNVPSHKALATLLIPWPGEAQGTGLPILDLESVNLDQILLGNVVGHQER